MNFIEGIEVELKREYVEDIKKTIVAFANTKGGTIYIGVDDNGQIYGLSNPDDVILRVTNVVRNGIKPDVTPFVECTIERYEEKDMIAVRVQKGSNCPYYLAGKGLRPEGVFVRQGASSAPASETAILKMIKDTDGENFEDMRSLNQELTFNTSAEAFGQKKVGFEPIHYRTLKMTNSDGIYTNLAMTLSDQCIHSTKIAVFQGTDKMIFRDRTELTGSLLSQLKEGYNFINRYNAVFSQVEGLYRKDVRDFPPEAIREALLNSIIHRDYGLSAATLISIFDDRIEIVSPGGLVKGITLEDIMAGLSITRNPNLANAFYRLELIEAYGTGIPKIFKLYEGCGRRPEISVTANTFKILLPNINYKGAIKYSDINDESIISLFREKSFVTRKDVEELTGLGQTAAGKILRELVEEDVIAVTGAGKNTKYLMK